MECVSFLYVFVFFHIFLHSCHFIVQLVNRLLEEIEDINKTLNESEEIVNHWVPTKDIPVDSIPSYLDDTKVRKKYFILILIVYSNVLSLSWTFLPFIINLTKKTPDKLDFC